MGGRGPPGTGSWRAARGGGWSWKEAAAASRRLGPGGGEDFVAGVDLEDPESEGGGWLDWMAQPAGRRLSTLKKKLVNVAQSILATFFRPRNSGLDPES